jgi:ribose transport system permease protein
LGRQSTSTVVQRDGSRGGVRRIAGFNELGLLVALGGIVLLIASFHPNFLAVPSLVNVGRQASFVGILGLGIVFLLSMREIDLSIGALYAVAAIGCAILMRDGVDPWIAAVGGILIGLTLGAINGFLSVALKLNTLIVTLGTISMYRGLTLLLTNASPVTGLPTEHAFFSILGGSHLGIPASVWAFVLITVVLIVVYRATRFGFVIRAIGSNEQAARLSGIAINRIRVLALMLMGVLCGISGVLTIAFFGSADPNFGIGWEFLAIAAAIIGGTSLAGGSGSVLGAFLGALMISVITSGLVQFGVTANWSQFVTGAVLITAVAVDALIRRRRQIRQATRG